MTANRKVASVNALCKWLHESGSTPDEINIKAVKNRDARQYKGLEEKDLRKLRAEIHRNRNPLHICIIEIMLGTNEIWIRGRGGIDACIMIRGIDGSLRGIHFKQYRPQLVLLDDLLKDDTAKSDTKREQVKNTFTDVVIPIGTKDTNILVVGTCLHEEDLMTELLKGKIPGVRSIKKSAVISFAERDDLWSDWEAKYNNLQDLDRIETAKSFFYDHQEEMLEGTEILWSEYLDYYYLMCKKQAMGDKSFYKEMQNDPRSTDDYIFRDIQYWDRLPEFEEMELVMYIDPAIKAGKRNDFSAITILGLHRKTKQKYVVDGSIYKLLPDDLSKLQRRRAISSISLKRNFGRIRYLLQ